jgi:hypothetical protein
MKATSGSMKRKNPSRKKTKKDKLKNLLAISATSPREKRERSKNPHLLICILKRKKNPTWSLSHLPPPPPSLCTRRISRCLNKLMRPSCIYVRVWRQEREWRLGAGAVVYMCKMEKEGWWTPNGSQEFFDLIFRKICITGSNLSRCRKLVPKPDIPNKYNIQPCPVWCPKC